MKRLHFPILAVVIPSVAECVRCARHQRGAHPRCLCGAEGPHGWIGDRWVWHREHRAKMREGLR